MTGTIALLLVTGVIVVLVFDRVQSDRRSARRLAYWEWRKEHNADGVPVGQVCGVCRLDVVAGIVAARCGCKADLAKEFPR